MSGAHNHALPSNGNEKSLWLALGLTTAFMVTEVIGGVLSGSLALISDAAHMFTDTAALGIALAAIRVAKRPGPMPAGPTATTDSRSSPRRSTR